MIFPLFNERHAIAALVRRVPPSIAETIVVDDGSDDGGPDLAREAGARVISQERRRGVGAAIRTGIEAARANGHGAVVVLAANGKDDPAEAPRVIEVGVSKTYPKGGGNYSKIRRVRDWWSIVKPTLLLWLGVRH